MGDFPEVMTIGEACLYLRVPRSSLYKLAQDGKIPCQKVGRHWRFRKERLNRWLDELPKNDELNQEMMQLSSLQPSNKE